MGALAVGGGGLDGGGGAEGAGDAPLRLGIDGGFPRLTALAIGILISPSVTMWKY